MAVQVPALDRDKARREMAATQIAVIDVETTGLYPFGHDRIVEIAALVITPDGNTLRQFSSLVNPQRDIGPTSIHGLTGHDVIDAPTFSDLAGELVQTLSGVSALAGHNVRFDCAFLQAEFDRIGKPWPDPPAICTMRLAGGGRLVQCCEDYHIPLPEQAHSAFDDATATAQLLARLLSDAPSEVRRLRSLSSIKWPKVARGQVAPVSRQAARKRHESPPSYLQRLLGLSNTAAAADPDNEAALAYTALLDRVLEDRRLDEDESRALLDLASHWGLSGKQILELHKAYLRQLTQTAAADGVVTEVERRDLLQVAQLLGETPSAVDDMLAVTVKSSAALTHSPEKPIARTELAGKRVCFTGELQCRLNGAPIARSNAEALAADRGLVVVESVTKKLDVLVVADPFTQSGKAKTARRYGVRIMHEPVFWQALGVPVQ